MSFTRPPRDEQPADERSGRWPSPGCRVLRDGHWILVGQPLTGIRTCPRPSPWRAARYRMVETLRDCAWEALIVAACAAPVTFTYIIWLYSTTNPVR